MGIAADVIQHLLWPSKRWFGIDVPFRPLQRSDIGAKLVRVAQFFDRAEEPELAGVEGLFQILQKQSTEQTREDAHGEKSPMPGDGQTQRKRPALSALVLLDSSLTPVGYNTEATCILSYPRNPKEIHPLNKYLEAQLRPLLMGLAALPPPLASFRSGRRRYRARISTLITAKPLCNVAPAHVLVLERQNRSADLSMVGQKFHLTPRERETLHFLLQGMTSKEIATGMGSVPIQCRPSFAW